jgi:DNA topoisomerase I
MAVEDFIPLKDVKQTVEKEVKRTPSIEERTTIERPGKPVPATYLLDSEGKKSPRKKPARSKTRPEKIEQPKKDSILIVTEKPQAAQKIAEALGSAHKYSEDGVSYFELERSGKKIVVASAVGHLFGLNYKEGQKGWPIFEIEWRPAYEKKNAAFTKKYYLLLKKLVKKAEEIIVATDYDIEGEVIGWNVLRFIANKKTARRMKYSTLTKNELEVSYDNSLPEPDWGQAYAGEARHILDWLYGINLSRALMEAIKTTGSFRIMSIGRVQGPALKIIVDREREIQKFKSEPYWNVIAMVKNHPFQYPEDIFDKKELEKFKNIKEGNAETVEKQEKIPPLPPFDLTTLQREAYRLHKLSPSQTLATAQTLYLDGLISYPRTSSQKVPESVQPKSILKSLERHFPLAKNATRKVPVEGKKSDPAHPSIYPTGEHKELEGAQEKLYELIVKRFIALFYEDAITENKNVTITSLEDSKIKFKSSGLKVSEEGWTKVYPATLQERDVPTLSGKVKIDEIKFEEKETQPPKRYTPTSLITTLEKKNLGTKATRSSIVDTLFDRGYLDGQSIKATPLGLSLIESLEKYSPIIIDENLTRKLEEKMEEIQEDYTKDHDSRESLEEKEKKVIEDAKRIITDISKEFKTKEIEIGKEILGGLTELRENQNAQNTLTKCPRCNKNDLRILYSKKTRRYFVACSGYPACTQTFSLPPNALIKKSDKICESCGFPKLLSIKKGKRPWEFCFNPECEDNKKRREEWEAKQKAAAETKSEPSEEKADSEN